jgi:hypothetical protein
VGDLVETCVVFNRYTGELKSPCAPDNYSLKNMQIYYIRRNQLDATKCWFIDSTCFEHYYAHLQEYISEYRFLVSKSGKI